MTFGRRVRAARDAAGLTQAQLTGRLLATGVRVPSTAVAKIETGTRPTTVVELEALAGALGVSAADLLGEGSYYLGPLIRAVNEAADARTELLASMRRYDQRRSDALAAIDEDRAAADEAGLGDTTTLEDVELLVLEHARGGLDDDGNPGFVLELPSPRRTDETE